MSLNSPEYRVLSTVTVSSATKDENHCETDNC
jgi:hypothetical protein